MYFPCVEQCPRQDFQSRKSLSIHQYRCKYFRDYDASLSGPIDTPSSPSPEVSSGSGLEPASKRQRIAGPASVIDEYQAGLGTPSRPLTRSQAKKLLTGFRLGHDVLPEAAPPLEPPPNTASASQPKARRATPFHTIPDMFGRYRVYPSRPLTIPDSEAPPAPILPGSDNSSPADSRSVNEIIYPCPNISTFYVQQHHWLRGGNKSLDDRDRLCDEVFLQPDFNPGDLAGVNLRALDSKLAASANTWDTTCPPAEGWRHVPIQIQVPPLRQTKLDLSKGLLSPKHYLRIPGLCSRKLTEVMRKAFSSNNVPTFHYEPFEAYWEPPGAPTGSAQRICDEIYSSPAMLKAHREVQRLKISDTTCTLPRCVAAFMFSSDGLQFGNFCHAGAWPIYGFFGNESKYERCKPSSNTCYVIAHVPKLPNSVKEQIAEFHRGRPPSAALLTHLRRELMHEVWASLLDDDFIHAWNHGIVIKCADGITRRVFPRILTYSADYPERVLVATIRNGGECPCPACLAKKASAQQLGTASDSRMRAVKRVDGARRLNKIKRARQLIYDLGHSVQSKGVETLLKAESYVPTLNAFSRRLGLFKFNVFSILVVDELHEVELGVWKSLFEHLVRVLHLSGNSAVTEFNQRFRAVPTFNTTIRMFSDDVASMSRVAARDFEDILQCCIPVFKGLLPTTCEEPAQRLLFIFAQWHGLAKLRLHTQTTLKLLKVLTTKLGTGLRDFAKLTESMDIRETPAEYTRRKKRSDGTQAMLATREQDNTANPPRVKGTGEGRRPCTLNLNRFKVHSIGHYFSTIETFGTTDSYSTQIGELNHRKIKAQYARTNKKDAEDQMTWLSDIAEVLENMDKELQQREQLSCPPEQADCEATQSLLNGSGYFIGLSERSEDMIPSIAQWVDRQREDDAMKLFIPQLKQHILARILGGRNHPDFNNNTLAQLQFHRGRMYRHKTLRINYTSYDVLRQQDVINPSTPQCFVALPAAHDPLELKNHPFIYAKVIGVYHANYVFRDLVPRRIDFVHVRWLYYDYDCPGGWDLCRLDRVSYDICRTEQDILDSFDFIDPNDIIRATHLIPDFHSGIANNLLNNSPGHSIAHDNEEYGDWKNYYVNRFVDRDMMMRYVGGGIGHFKQDVNAPMVTPEDCAMGHNDEGHPEDDAESDKEDEENGVARGVQADDGLDELSEEEEGSESAAQDEDEDDL